MMHALHLLVLSLAAAGGPGGGRAGADSARVATLLAALAHTDPVICDLIGDQLGNFWMGGEEGRRRRTRLDPSHTGSSDSVSGCKKHTPVGSMRTTRPPARHRRRLPSA